MLLRSSILVCLILFLIRSFWSLLCSGFPHHTGRLYSHRTHRLTQALQAGWFSSHFFRRRRHVKQPIRKLDIGLHFEYLRGKVTQSEEKQAHTRPRPLVCLAICPLSRRRGAVERKRRAGSGARSIDLAAQWSRHRRFLG